MTAPTAPSVQSGGGWGVYVHVPFCASRCSYCDFNTYAGEDSLIPTYFNAVQEEIAAFFRGFSAYESRGIPPVVETVFFGGGTPSYVGAKYIARVLEAIPPPFRCGSLDIPGGSGDWECTIEANPGTVTRAKLAAWKSAGANRLSFGLQSTDDGVLSALGRRHTYADYKKTLDMAKRAGFDNISADLLFGLPGQTVSDWEKTLADVLRDGGLTHISCYSLSVEAGTPLACAIESGEVPSPDEDADRDMYAVARSVLASAGLAQYEISNFAIPGYECAHNLKYWTGAPYRGFGAGAASFNGSRRFSNARYIAEYADLTRLFSGGASRVDGGGGDEAAVVEREGISKAELEREYLILRLRLTEGFALADYRERFGRDFLVAKKNTAGKLIDEGLLEITPATPTDSGRARLTVKGMDMANRVFAEFI